MRLSRAFALGGLLLLCTALTTPSFAGNKEGGVFGWSALDKVVPNCTWRCPDGRTGSAEVNTEQQCAAACSGACGKTCFPSSINLRP